MKFSIKDFFSKYEQIPTNYYSKAFAEWHQKFSLSYHQWF